VQQFVMKSADSKFIQASRVTSSAPWIRPTEGLIVETHSTPWERHHGVRARAIQERKPAPFIVTHDGPKLGNRHDAAASSTT
jgi:hypothetical protein